MRFRFITRLRRSARVFIRAHSGVAAVEFALIAPLLIVMLYGTLELSQAISADRKLTKVSSTVADLLSRVNTITPTEVNQVFDVARVLMEPFDSSGMEINVYYVTDTNGVRQDEWQCWNGIGDRLPAPGELPAGILERDGNVLITSVRYGYVSPITHLIMDRTITFAETFYAKPRLGGFITPYPSTGICAPA